jgi:hypothetical protein
MRGLGQAADKATGFPVTDKHHSHHALATPLSAAGAGFDLSQRQLIATPPCQNCSRFQITNGSAFSAREFDTLIRAHVACPKRCFPVHRLTRNLRRTECG